MRQPKALWWGSGYLCAVITMLAECGCTSPLFRGQSPDVEAVSKAPPGESGTRYVGDLAVPWNEKYLKVEGVGLVTNLRGTGSDPPPGGLRDQLIKEMQTHDVKNPARILASRDIAMVMVRGFIPPAAAKDETFDLEVRVPPRSETTSLEGGWLMQTRLREVQLLDQSLYSGRIYGLGRGTILVDALFDTAEDKVLKTRGRILGGGTVTMPRQVGLVIRPEHSSVRTSALIATAINARFHHFDRGVKSGVAKPTRDNHVELAVHPRYKHHMRRYFQVISQIAVGESPSERLARMGETAAMLLEPTSAETAALRLEACGEDAAGMLRKGLQAPDRLVRFYAAEALAYLDDSAAADVLFEIARDERALRWRALTALAVLDEYAAEERLVELMNAPSAETRYGAFHALRVRNPLDPVVRGEMLGGELAYHVVSTAAEPLIHFSRARRPEIVVFGHGLRMRPPAFLFAGKDILIKAVNDQQVKVSRFRPGKETEHLICSCEVDDIVRAIVRVGGSYPEVLAALQSAKDKGDLACRLELDAMPRAERPLPQEATPPAGEKTLVSGLHASPIPDMFLDRLGRRGETDAADGIPPADTSEEKPAQKGFLARMASWLSE